MPLTKIQKPHVEEDAKALYTNAFKGDDGVPFLGFPEMPEFPPEKAMQSTFHRVRQSEVGRLDNISYQYYGSPNYIWFILEANKLLNPFEIKEDDVLEIPPMKVLLNYIIRGMKP